ncbi:hypothetical protein A3754_08290 [Alcanivorax sp. HI0083]|nr:MULTISPECIES: sulfotransferase family 2 domain-containing protein [unclassified Alcanivorax]KZY34945.1 hypothetical protein A3730_15560 [Alcanivorax sp. HI0044]KZZ27244.1 hypothetical protein A3754_08290 [Alcanivorax sp. HI0083]
MSNRGSLKRAFIKSFYIQFRKLAKSLLHACKAAIGGHIEKPEFVVLGDKKVAYLVVSKAACSSIKKAMVAGIVDDDIQDNYSIHQNHKVAQLTVRGRFPDAEQCHVFTYVRNPFSRLVSSYINKFEDFEKIRMVGFEYADYLGGYLEMSDSFEAFVEKVCNIPDRLSDRHFMGQYYLIHSLSPRLPDQIEKLEEIERSFPALSEHYGFGDVPHFNRTGGYNYEDYYSSAEMVEMVYRRYRRDVEEFGYQAEYERLRSRFDV